MAFLTTQPIWIIGTVLIGLATLTAMAGPVLVRRRVGLERLILNNEVAGFKFATVGVLYAVLLAFAIIIVWEKFSDAEAAVSREAGATATLFRLADGIGAAAGPALHARLAEYARAAIEQEWPAMETGRESAAAREALDATYTALLGVTPTDSRGAALMAEALHQLDTITGERRTRLFMARGIVPGVLWFVLIAGAVLTIGFTLFFGAENLRVQALMTGTLAFLIVSGLLVIIAINDPFAGTIRVGPEALASVLEDLGGPARATAAEAEHPAALCAPDATDDTLRPLPMPWAPVAATLFGIRAAPDLVARSTVYRCDQGRALACTAGANLPCGRADTRDTLAPVAEYCRANPGASVVPMYVSGHDSAYSWQCRSGVAVHGAERPLDRRGFFRAYWKPLSP